VRWKILFYRILQFIYESKSERIIEIGPHLPKLSCKNKSGTFFMAHGVDAETWTSVVVQSAAQRWTVVQGLQSGATYEVKMIAGDDRAYCPETQTVVKRVEIDVQRGKVSHLLTCYIQLQGGPEKYVFMLLQYFHLLKTVIIFGTYEINNCMHDAVWRNVRSRSRLRSCSLLYCFKKLTFYFFSYNCHFLLKFHKNIF